MTNLSPRTEPTVADSTMTLATARAERGKPPRSAWRMMLPTMTPWLAFGLILIGGITLFGVIGPFFVQDPTTIRDTGLQPPSAEHILGTTQTGQDVFAQLAYATAGSLQIGLIVGVLATLLSAFFGILGAYIGGFADEAFSLFSNVFLVIPGLPLVIVISGFVPQEQRGLWTIAVVLAITGWAASSRVLRAQTLSLRRRDFVEASRASGERTWRIIGFELLPNLTAVIASGFVGTVIFAVLSEITLAFIGVVNNGWNWGTILFWAQGQQALGQDAWWWFVPAGLAIALLGMSLSLINFGIDEFVSPRLRSAGKTKLRTARGRTVRMRIGFTPVMGEAKR
jgi:peptide/nickel transport system permease protein